MKKQMLFISFIDFGENKSGSSVRPQQMYQAFIQLGYEVRLLQGQQNRGKERRKNVKAIMEWLKENRPAFCYVEPPTGPFFQYADLLLLKKLCKMKVPVGLFYRDALWRFAKWWDVPPVKKFFLTLAQRWNYRWFQKYCDILYFPSQSMARLFEHKHKELLPPAASPDFSLSQELHHCVTYVGGISRRYGTDILLEAMRIIREDKGRDIRLLLVCRENTIETFAPQAMADPSIEVLHVSGSGALKEVYRRADMGLFPGRRDIYMDFAVPVKLFEYIGYGLPVVTTDCVESKNLCEASGFGVCVSDTPEAFAQGILRLYDEPELMRTCRENAQKAAAEQTWQSRAQKVARDLQP